MGQSCARGWPLGKVGRAEHKGGDLSIELQSSVNLIADKPDILIPFDSHRLTDLAQMPGLAIAEMAGRDSVAAILAVLESDDVQMVLPTAAYTGTEYGDWRGFERNTDWLRAAVLERHGKRVLDLVWIGSPRLWRALNGRYIADIVRRFGAYSPCLACHFYLHAVRIPLAVQLGVRVVIGGDRERHGSRAKINQLPPVVDAYQRLFRQFGLELREPLRSVADAADLDRLLGPGWPGGSPQPSCLFSGNYSLLDGRQAWTESQVLAFVDGFVYPVIERVVAAHLARQPVDYLQVAGEVLSS